MQLLESTIVSKLGYGSTTASSGEEAVKAFEEASKNGKPFEAFAMQLTLPCGISGLEATIAIKQIDAEATHISPPCLRASLRNEVKPRKRIWIATAWPAQQDPQVDTATPIRSRQSQPDRRH